jgi:hypothetical protein
VRQSNSLVLDSSCGGATCAHLHAHPKQLHPSACTGSSA